MKAKTKEIAYIGILIFCVFIIYNTFHAAFADVRIGQIEKKINIFLLSFNNYVYLLVGLLLMGFTQYVPIVKFADPLYIVELFNESKISTIEAVIYGMVYLGASGMVFVLAERKFKRIEIK